MSKITSTNPVFDFTNATYVFVCTMDDGSTWVRDGVGNWRQIKYSAKTFDYLSAEWDALNNTLPQEIRPVDEFRTAIENVFLTRKDEAERLRGENELLRVDLEAKRVRIAELETPTPVEEIVL